MRQHAVTVVIRGWLKSRYPPAHTMAGLSPITAEDIGADEQIAECIVTALLCGDYPERAWPKWFEASSMAATLNAQVGNNDRKL